MVSPAGSAVHVDHDAPTGSSAPESGTVPPVREPRTRLQKGIRQPRIYTDGTIRYGILTSTREPQNIRAALGDATWKKAMEEEYDALMKNKTCHLVPPSSTRKDRKSVV